MYHFSHSYNSVIIFQVTYVLKGLYNCVTFCFGGGWYVTLLL